MVQLALRVMAVSLGLFVAGGSIVFIILGLRVCLEEFRSQPNVPLLYSSLSLFGLEVLTSRHGRPPLTHIISPYS